MSGKKYLTGQTYFKPTYIEGLKYIIPDYLFDDDVSTFGVEEDINDLVINSHINLAENFSSLIQIDPVVGTIYSSINTIDGLAPYFVKQNDLTVISPDTFNINVLRLFGKSINEFSTSSEFSDYLEDTLLSSIRLNSPVISDWATSTSHRYLIENLSWLYFLNTSGVTFNPSSLVRDILVEKTFYGKTIELNDCLKLLLEFIWKNEYTDYYPSVFASGAGKYLSGTQGLDNLKTWIDVLYSPLFSDRSNFFVKDKFEYYFQTRSNRASKVGAGPFNRLIKAMSFLAFDISDQSELLKSIYDIEDCPDEYLPLMAELIGWDLFGSNPQRWRLQLKNAVEVYKKIGTKKSIQFALNTVFPKDIFNIESRVTELWESYVPFLLHYSLATESSYFKSLATWTPQLASQMNVVGYSSSSLDESIKCAVDRIIYETYLQFSGSFNIPDKSNKFYYRGREYPIPPFEEYPYYVNVELSKDMIEFMADRLVCFGVRNDFAVDFINYVTSSSLEADDDIRSSSWLFFTSGYSEPPNISRLIQNLNSEKFEYASLWSGKSSHFKLILDALEFDFSKSNSDDIDSEDALLIAADIINKVAPAHAIPLVRLTVSSQDFINFQSSATPAIYPYVNEPFAGRIGENRNVSGIMLSTYLRGINTAGKTISRQNLVSRVDPLFTGATFTGENLDRTTVRRRAYENLLPMAGYYDRTGFNMPVGLYMTSSLSGLPLGFIPSSLSFQTISDYKNIPDVYSRCNTLNSNASYFGYNVSNTLPCRGMPVGYLLGNHLTRGELSPVIETMHALKEREKPILASATLYSSSINDDYTFSVSNVFQSLANSATNNLGWFPVSVNDYFNFEFGRDLHKLYRYYTKDFERHQLAENILDFDGPTIFSHTFGPVLINHDFSFKGTNGDTLISTSVSSSIDHSPSGPVFSIGGGYGSYAASTSTSMYVDDYELINSSIIHGVEFIQTSGGSVKNSIEAINIPYSQKKIYDDPYMFDNTFIKLVAKNKFPRIRLDISKYLSPNSIQKYNFLMPDCKYSIKAKCLASDKTGLKLGNQVVGFWIHTKPEGGTMWSLKNDGTWERHNQLISRYDIFYSYYHGYYLPLRNRNEEASVSSNFECLDLVTNISQNVSPIIRLKESDFEEFEFTFNTCNNSIVIPADYLETYGQVHRKTQNYVIEFFAYPYNDPDDKFILLDKIEMQNKTFKRLSERLVLQGCPETRLELTKKEVMNIFRFWNDIVGKNSNPGLASRRIAEGASELFLASERGGSRYDYRFVKEDGAYAYHVFTNNVMFSEIQFFV